jgi:hypothetical protein
MSIRTWSTTVALATALAFGAAACGDDESATPQTTAPPATTTESTPVTTAPAATKPKPKPAPKPKPKVRTIRIFVEQGRPRGGIKRPLLEQGERVRIVVRTDAGVEVHLHGYDITRPVRPGQPTQLAFRADIPGRFELELHHPDAVLADLEVRP